MVYTQKIAKELYTKYKYVFNYSFVVFLAGINSILNYVSSVYINRNLSVADFAEYNAITSIYNVIIFTVSTYSYYIMQNYHTSSLENKKSYWAYGIVIAFIVFIVYLISTPLMPIFFNIKALNIYLIFSIVVFISILVIVPHSIVRANALVKVDYSISIIANIFAKYLLLGIFIFTGLSILRSSITMVLHMLLTFILYMYFIKKNNLYNAPNIREINKYINKSETKNILKTIYPILISNAIFNLVIVFDVLMSIRFLDKENAGYYATISIINKMFFYVSSTIGSIMYSLLIYERGKNKNIKKEKSIILLSFIFNLVVIFMLSIVLYFFGSKIILIQFTEKYKIIITFIPQIILFGFSISVAAIFFSYSLFYKWYKPLYIYPIFIIALYIALRNNERTFSMFMYLFKIFFILLLIYNLLIFIIHLMRNKKV